MKKVALILPLIIGLMSCGGSGSSGNSTPPSGPTPASIETPPAPVTVMQGQTATFSVAAAGTAPITYVWTENGSVVGSDAASYTTALTTSADNNAKIGITVSNATGSATASTVLTVTTDQGPPPPFKFVQAVGVSNATSSGAQKYTCTFTTPTVAGDKIKIFAVIQQPIPTLPAQLATIAAVDDVGDQFSFLGTSGQSASVSFDFVESFPFYTEATTLGGATQVTFWTYYGGDQNNNPPPDPTKAPVGTGIGAGACLEYSFPADAAFDHIVGGGSPTYATSITSANAFVLAFAAANNGVPAATPIVQAGPLPWVVRYQNGDFVVEEFVALSVGSLDVQFYDPTFVLPTDGSTWPTEALVYQ